MRLLFLLPLLLLSACGGRYDVSGDVTVHHELEISDLKRYFLAQCQRDNPDDSLTEQSLCAEAKVADVLEYLFGGATPPTL